MEGHMADERKPNSIEDDDAIGINEEDVVDRTEDDDEEFEDVEDEDEDIEEGE